VTLARYQQSLERALRGRPVDPSDVYAMRVRSTRQWRLLAESIRFWRRLAIQRGAPMTSTLLLRQGHFHTIVDRLFAERLASPDTATMAEAFLVRVGGMGDDVAAALARTELALQRAARGFDTPYEIDWPIDPIAALANLLDPSRADWPEESGYWHLTVAHRVPGFLSAARRASPEGGHGADAMNPASFARDIRPLFRPIDVEHMRPFSVLLDDYSYMADAANDHQHARDVRDYLTGIKQPQMPIGGPFWTADQLALYERWMNEGFQP
jgi:hypothetical protein